MSRGKGKIMVNNVVSELQNARVLNKEAALKMKLEGTLAEAVTFIERNQITDVGLWQK